MTWIIVAGVAEWGRNKISYHCSVMGWGGEGYIYAIAKEKKTKQKSHQVNLTPSQTQNHTPNLKKWSDVQTGRVQHVECSGDDDVQHFLRWNPILYEMCMPGKSNTRIAQGEPFHVSPENYTERTTLTAARRWELPARDKGPWWLHLFVSVVCRTWVVPSSSQAPL